MTDVERISNLMSAYCKYADEHNTAAWVALFAPDAVISVNGAIIAGQHAIEAWQASRKHPSSRHFMSNILIEVNGDVASGSCYFMSVTSAEHKIVVMGEYRARFVKSTDDWTILEWHIAYSMPAN